MLLVLWPLTLPPHRVKETATATTKMPLSSTFYFPSPPHLSPLRHHLFTFVCIVRIRGLDEESHGRTSSRGQHVAAKPSHEHIHEPRRACALRTYPPRHLDQTPTIPTPHADGISRSPTLHHHPHFYFLLPIACLVPPHPNHRLESQNLPESPTTTVNKGAKLMEARAKIRERRAQIRQDTIDRTATATAASPVKNRNDNAPAGPETRRAVVTSPLKTRPLSSRAPKLTINTKVTGLTGLSAKETGADAIQILDGDGGNGNAACAAAKTKTTAAPAGAAPAARPPPAPAAPASPPRGATIPAMSSVAAAVTPPRPSSDVEAAALAPSSSEKPVYQKGFFGEGETRGGGEAGWGTVDTFAFYFSNVCVWGVENVKMKLRAKEKA